MEFIIINLLQTYRVLQVPNKILKVYHIFRLCILNFKDAISSNLFFYYIHDRDCAFLIYYIYIYTKTGCINYGAYNLQELSKTKNKKVL